MIIEIKTRMINTPQKIGLTYNKKTTLNDQLKFQTGGQMI